MMTFLIDSFFFGFAVEFIDWLREHREWIYAFSFATGVIGVLLSGLRLYSIYWKNSKTDESIEEIKARMDASERQQEDLRRKFLSAESKLNAELARQEKENRERMEKERIEQERMEKERIEKERMDSENSGVLNDSGLSSDHLSLASSEVSSEESSEALSEASSKPASGRMKKILPVATAVFVPVAGFLLKHFLRSNKRDKGESNRRDKGDSSGQS